jgi:GT2 family glycosyltransferase
MTIAKPLAQPITQLAVLLTCHNRREKTLAALTSLFAQTVLQPLSAQTTAQSIKQTYAQSNAQTRRPANMETTFISAELSIPRLTVFLVDDGCTDGTAAAVAAHFPHVQIIQGSGQLFWNRGMRLAWQSAIAYAQQLQPAHKFDAYIWLNDDVWLDPQALARLLDGYVGAMQNHTRKVGAIVGCFLDPSTLAVTYGGRCRDSTLKPFSPGPLLAVSPCLQRCDFINGNFCLIPADAVEAIGILDEAFTHSIGDYDYGLRLQHAGYSLWQASGFSGYCTANSNAGQIFNAKVPLGTRVGWLKRPNVWPPAAEWALFVRRHGGCLWPYWWLRVWLRGRFPRLWLWLSQKASSSLATDRESN